MTFGPNRGLHVYVRCASSRVDTVIYTPTFVLALIHGAGCDEVWICDQVGLAIKQVTSTNETKGHLGCPHLISTNCIFDLWITVKEYMEYYEQVNIH